MGKANPMPGTPRRHGSNDIREKCMIATGVVTLTYADARPEPDVAGPVAVFRARNLHVRITAA